MAHIHISFPTVVGVLGLCAVSLTVQAKTVAWYRFEGLSGDVTQDTVFTNSVDAAKYPMYAGVCNFGGNNKYAKSKLVYTADYMPWVTNGFETVDVYDPVVQRFYVNSGGVAVNGTRLGSNDDPHAELFVDDHADLQLQTFTLEFFLRQPDITAGFRCLVCRSGKAYNAATEALRLSMSVLGGGESHFRELTFATVDGEPLYNTSGVVTNTTVNKLNPYHGVYPFDDGKWRHVAIVCDGAAKEMSFYVNHSLVDSVTYTGNLYYEPAYPLCFGGHPQCTYYNCAADFSEIRISDEALTTAQMLTHKRPAPRTNLATDPKTLLYFPFEGSRDVITATEMATTLTYTPFYRNHAVNSPFALIDAKPYSKSGVTNAVPPAAVSDVPGDVRSGLYGAEADANAQGVHITTNGVDGCDYALPIVVHTSSNVQQDLFGDSCTFEAFFKIPYTSIACPSKQLQMFSLCKAFRIDVSAANNWLYGYLSSRVGDDVNLVGGAKNNIGGKTDGKWHHVAFVWDKTTHHADFYVDYTWCLGVENAAFDPQPSDNSYINDLLLGGSYWKERWFTNLTFDEVRVTRGALKPHEFLTTLPVATEDESLPARATFDKTSDVGPYSDFYTVVAKSGTVVQSTRRAGHAIVQRTGETFVNTNNVGSLAFTNGTLKYAERDVLAAEDQFTVEMFLRADASVADEGIARINRAGTTGVVSSATRTFDVTNTVTWALAFADAEGHLKVKVDTDAAEGRTVTFAGDSFADGKWHHLGLVFAYDTEDAANTRIALYRDGESVGSQVVTGHVLTRPYRMNFMLGAGEVGASNFTGCIDELRISSQALDPDYFMTVLRRGFVFFLR